MIRPTKGKVLVEYSEKEWAENSSGFILPSQQTMRQMLKKKDRVHFDMDNKPPDIYRWGRYVAGETREKIPSEAFVYYNKHDGEEFVYDDTTYLVLPEHLVLAYYVPETTT